MNSNRTLIVVLLVALLAVCCCIAGVLGVLVVRGWNWGGLSLGSDRVEVTEPFSRAFDVRGPITLDLDAPVGDITIRAGTEQQVVITATKRAWGGNRSQAQEVLDSVSISAEQAADQVRVRASGLSGVHIGRSPQVDFTISVPRETALKVESKVGRLQVTGTTGDVLIKADVGEMTLTDVTPVKELDVETRVAGVEFAGVLVPNAHYRLTSDVGRIALRLPEDSTFRIDARSDVGDVRVDFTVAGHSSRGGIVSKEVRGEVGQNPTTELYLRSRIGEIVVRSGR